MLCSQQRSLHYPHCVSCSHHDTAPHPLARQNRFDELQEGVISYGPCQFPTLGFIVDRYKRIQVSYATNIDRCRGSSTPRVAQWCVGGSSKSSVCSVCGASSADAQRRARSAVAGSRPRLCGVCQQDESEREGKKLCCFFSLLRRYFPKCEGRRGHCASQLYARTFFGFANPPHVAKLRPTRLAYVP